MKLSDLNLQSLLQKTDLIEVIDFDGKIKYFTEFDISHPDFPNRLIFWRDDLPVFNIDFDEEIFLVNENEQIQTKNENGERIFLTFHQFDSINLREAAGLDDGRADNEGLKPLQIS